MLNERPRLLLYCQHSVGLGHLVRSLALTEALAESFDVTLLSGGPLPEGVRAPDGVEVVQLPPLGMASDHKIISRDAGRSVEEAFALRRRALIDALQERRPEVVVIELFPFGRRKFRVELLPLLDAATTGAHRPLIACSLRDILVDRGDEQEDFDEQACQIANRYFDCVLLHADERLNRLEDSFRPRTPLRIPVHATGFVVPGAAPRPAARRAGVVVSAGGGIVGGPLFRAAVDAHRLRRTAEPMTIVAGPFLPEDEWRWLRREADRTEGLEAVRSVDNLRDVLAGAAVSVSQAGYNTTFDLLRSGVSALVVPYAPPGEDEQTRRARSLERLGALRVLDPVQMSGESLAAAIDATARFSPEGVDLRLDGGAESAAILTALVAKEAAA
jgi:predicted glycosyltransferase